MGLKEAASKLNANNKFDKGVPKVKGSRMQADYGAKAFIKP